MSDILSSCLRLFPIFRHFICLPASPFVSCYDLIFRTHPPHADTLPSSSRQGSWRNELMFTLCMNSRARVRWAGMWSGLLLRASLYQCSAILSLFIFMYNSPAHDTQNVLSLRPTKSTHNNTDCTYKQTFQHKYAKYSRILWSVSLPAQEYFRQPAHLFSSKYLYPELLF